MSPYVLYLIGLLLAALGMIFAMGSLLWLAEFGGGSIAAAAIIGATLLTISGFSIAAFSTH